MNFSVINKSFKKIKVDWKQWYTNERITMLPSSYLQNDLDFPLKVVY